MAGQSRNAEVEMAAQKEKIASFVPLTDGVLNPAVPEELSIVISSRHWYSESLLQAAELAASQERASALLGDENRRRVWVAVVRALLVRDELAGRTSQK